MRYVIPISGKDSLATAIIQNKIEPDLPYEYLFNDTGFELPETYNWLKCVNNQLGFNLITVGESLEDIIWLEGILPSPKTRFCTRKSKIIPMENFLIGGEVTIYLGLRYDEKGRKGYIPPKKSKITPRYPLIENEIILNDIYKIVPENLLPPSFFWPELFERVKEKLKPFNIDLKESDLSHKEKSILFSWRSRPNCYNCFYMSYYEWIGLSEFHPLLFLKAVDMENTTGASNYTINQGIDLVSILKYREHYLNNRANKVCKIYLQMKQQTKFLLSDQDMILDYNCGPFCGK